MATAGRPRSFDKDEALKSLCLWEKRLEEGNHGDLIESIGMKAPVIHALVIKMPFLKKLFGLFTNLLRSMAVLRVH
jgi:hypothetical protein